MNSGPEDRGPEDRGPEDQGPEDIITEGCFALQQLHVPIAKIQLYSQSRPMLQAQTHGYVLFIVTEGVTFNKQRYFKQSSEFFDAQSSLLSVLQSHIPVETIMHVTFDPGTCAHLARHAATCLVALHAIKETILGFYRVKKEYKKLMDTVK